MNGDDRKLMLCISFMFISILIKYMLWDVYNTDFIGLSELGYFVVQWSMNMLLLVSLVGTIWFGLIKK